MRLATYIDPTQGNDARFGIVGGDGIIDVVAAANRLQRAVPATSVKTALTTGAHTLAALADLVQAAEGAWTLTPVADVPLEATVRVKPGERVALDGVVTRGTSAINQAPVTGESIPVA